MVKKSVKHLNAHICTFKWVEQSLYKNKKVKKKKRKEEEEEEQYEREGKINGKKLIEHLNDLMVDI